MGYEHGDARNGDGWDDQLPIPGLAGRATHPNGHVSADSDIERRTAAIAEAETNDQHRLNEIWLRRFSLHEELLVSGVILSIRSIGHSALSKLTRWGDSRSRGATESTIPVEL